MDPSLGSANASPISASRRWDVDRYPAAQPGLWKAKSGDVGDQGFLNVMAMALEAGLSERRTKLGLRFEASAREALEEWMSAAA